MGPRLALGVGMENQLAEEQWATVKAIQDVTVGLWDMSGVEGVLSTHSLSALFMLVLF